MKDFVGTDEHLTCIHPIYCNSTILYQFQMAGLFNDSKFFVDSPFKFPLESTLPTLIDFLFNDTLGRLPSAGKINELYTKYFDMPGSELEIADLPSKDFPHYENLSPALNEWAVSLHETWSLLARKVNLKKYCSNCITSLPIKKRFIVPGGRFAEQYYWDSYWIIKGLLVGELYDIVYDIMDNMYQLIDELGFVPNGNRLYYTNRSQPPMLTQIVKDVFENRLDINIIRRALPWLHKEYNFWMTRKVQKLDSSDQLNVYQVNSTHPRPESFVEDLKMAQSFQNVSMAIKFYSSIAAGAESGWDFSSRWIRGETFNLTSIDMENIVPVDLNAIIYLNEVTLAWFHQLLDCYDIKKDTGICSKENSFDNVSDSIYHNIGLPNDTVYGTIFFKNAAFKRKTIMHKYFWNSTEKLWIDYDVKMRRNTHTNGDNYFLSSIYPLWAKSYSLDETRGVTQQDLNTFLDNMNRTLLGPYPGGAPTSFKLSKQQWDHPNAFPPLQWIAVEGLLNLPGDKTKSSNIVKSLIQRWVNSNYCGWNKTKETLRKMTPKDYIKLTRRSYQKMKRDQEYHEKGAMYEKYDVRYLGKPGFGGEYIVQDGFGWSNGVILDWLKRFRNGERDLLYAIKDPETCIEMKQGQLQDNNGGFFNFGIFMASLVLLTISYLLIRWIRSGRIKKFLLRYRLSQRSYYENLELTGNRNAEDDIGQVVVLQSR